MTRVLHVAPDRTLPVAVLQDSTTIFGRKRTGKSNNAVVIVEEALDLHAQVIVLDPKGDWWGITSSADGKSEGYPVVVIGGKHGTDGVALNPHAGAATAEWVIQTGYSVIVDLQGLSVADVERFCAPFLRVIRRHKEANPGPILVVVDEADELAPEDQRDRLHVIETYRLVVWMVKRGGFAGIGTLCITQRPASLSKNVTTQSETVVVLQVSGSQDLDAVSEALKHHVKGVTKKERTAALEDLLREVVQLEKGQTVLVSAAAGLKGAIHRIQFRRRKTFDSGATPKFGERPRQPKVVAKVAIAQLTAAMEKAVADVQANDPAALRAQQAAKDKRIRELEAAVVRLKQRPERVETKTERVEIPVLKNGALKSAQKLAASLVKVSERIALGAQDLVRASEVMRDATAPIAVELHRIQSVPTGAAVAQQGVAAAAPVGTAASRPVPDSTAMTRGSRGERSNLPVGQSTHHAGGPAARTEGITGPQQRILDALAVLEQLGLSPASKVQLALFAHASPTSSAYANNLGALRSSAHIEYPRGGFVGLTDGGRALANAAAAPSTVEDLHHYVERLVSGPQWRIVRALIDAYPSAIAKEDLAAAAEASVTSSAFANNLGALRSLGLIDYPAPGHVAALPVLFMEGRP